MSYLLLFLVPVLGLAVAWVLFHVFGYGIRDLVALGVLTSTAFYLSRFDQIVWTELFGRPYPGFFWFLLGLAVALYVARLLIPLGEPLGFAVPTAVGIGFAYLAILSGFVRGGFVGFGSALQILVIGFGPILVAMQTVDLIPRTREASARLRDSFVLLGGLVTPVFLIATAIAAPLLSRFLGWGVTSVGRESGFIRGWSPLGGPISTGFVLVLAYGLAMHEAVGRRRRVLVVVLVLIGAALLFTLSRSAVMMMAVFHIVYFWRLIRRSPGRVIAVGLTCVALFVVLFVQLDERYSFQRFLSTDDSSTAVRASSAVAALSTSFEYPLLGQGPGLLYDEIRTDWLDRRELGATQPESRERSFILANRVSAMEPHNLYLLLAVEHGWPAAVLVVFGLGWVWRRSRLPASHGSVEDASLAAALNGLWIASFCMFLTASTPLVNAQASVFFWTFAFYTLHFRAVVGREARVAAAELEETARVDPGPGGRLASTARLRG